jgi:hypothetical protein
VKKWVLSWFVTPTRVRKIVASVVSWLIYRAIVRGTWDTVLSVARWMRRLADFLESWDATDLPAAKDKLIADLVGSAITDESVDKLIERVAAMKAEHAEVVATGRLLHRRMAPAAFAARAECGMPDPPPPEILDV